MFLQITTTHRPATDLGYLLHKNPVRAHEVGLTFGTARLFFPEASEKRCTAALVLDVDPVALVRGKGGGEGLLAQYVNDRPYAASSFLSVAMGRVLREAIGGRSRERQELADSQIPLEVIVAPLPARGGADLVRRLFGPLGHTVTCAPILLDPRRPDWGDSHYVTLKLAGTCRLADLLTHLVVLIPVLDAQKHYFIADDEVEKLLKRGEGWLDTHPERELIVTRYLKGRRTLIMEALARLAEEEALEAEATLDIARKDTAEEAIEKPLRLHDVRLDTVAATLKALGASRVLDLGCGEGKLIGRLVKDRQFTEIVGVEVGSISLARAARWLEKLPDLQRQRVKLLQGALIYRDTRLRGFDAAALVEVIEHIEPDRLGHMERAVFGDAAPRAVIVTTPNADYNALFPTLPAGRFRHDDHRFEWSRAEFATWCARVATDFGYEVRLAWLGDEDATHGAPSQIGVFTR
jgi:3' terminal RNA ribose 2'-O-methyltransferase Hen1